MRQIERVADGRRRFFAADGVVSDVLLRDRKAHQDVGLERGRDYEIERGGVVLRTVPKQGATVIILAGDRVRDDGGGLGATPAAVSVSDAFRQEASPRMEGLADSLCRASPLLRHPSSSTIAGAGLAFPAAATAETNAPVAPENQPGETVFTKEADGTLTIDLDALKRALVLATRDTNDATPRTPEWQDELARLTAIMLKANTLNGVKSAFMDIESYLRGET